MHDSAHSTKSVISKASMNESEEGTGSLISRGSTGASLLAPIDAAREASGFDTFVTVSGRQFLNDETIKYFLPSDQIETNRMMTQHYLLRYLWQSNFASPVEKDIFTESSRVLDVGCGPGAWVMDMAREFPLSTFVGIDIAPLFPDDNVKPSNAGFLHSNAIDGLPFHDNTFNLVHQRLLLHAMPQDEWRDSVLSDMVRVTKVGGYIEIMDMDLTYHNPGPISKQLEDTLANHIAELGMDREISSLVPKYLEATGKLTDIRVEVRKCPFGQWAGKVGQMALQDLLAMYDSLSVLLQPALGVSPNEYKDLIAEMGREMNENQTYSNVFRFYARKI